MFALLVVTALGMVGVGLFPEDMNNGAHVISAGTQFVTGNAAMIVFGTAANEARRWRAFAVFSITFGVTGLLATALFAQGYGLGLGVGGLERVAAYTLPIWLITAGVLMMRKFPTSTTLDNSFPPRNTETGSERNGDRSRLKPFGDGV